MMNSKVITITRKNVRIFVGDLTKVGNDAISIQKTSPVSSLLLGIGISVFGLLGVIQENGSVQVIYTPSGPIDNMIVEINDQGHLRAMIDNRSIATEYDDDIKKLNTVPIQLFTGAKGSLKVVSNINGKSFGGEVDIKKGNITSDLAYYFYQSTQIYSAVISDVALADKKSFKKVHSAIFQLLPGHSEKDIIWIENQTKKKISSFKSINEFIKNLDGKITNDNEIIWKCNCSKTKSKAIFKTIPIKEQKELIIKYNHLELICNFCTKKYIFKEIIKME